MPRCQSRHATLDSTWTDELDCAKDPSDNNVELHKSINKSNEVISDLQKQLARSAQDITCLEEEIAR